MKNAVLKILDVCICSTKKMKSKADKVYITFKGHFKMLSIKGISIFKIDAISIQQCFAFENLNVIAVNLTHNLLPVPICPEKLSKTYRNTENKKKGNLNLSILYIIYIDIVKIYRLHFFLVFIYCDFDKYVN